MKILYLSSAGFPDYLCDTIFHGFRTIYKQDCIDVNKLNYLYKNNIKYPYGKGFTIGNLLEDINIDRSDIELKIKNKYFDIIVYGSIRRCNLYFDLVSSCYDANKIILLDGEDDTTIANYYLTKGIYFKRELIINEIKNQLYPITFSIPKEKIYNEEYTKEKQFAKIDPNNKLTYIYDNENEYYNDYRTSIFGYTQKKAGWDCLRHYEIIANKCIPIFRNLQDCPENTLYYFPKRQCCKLIDTYNSINHIEIIDWLNMYLNKNLTTEHMCNNILNHLN